MFRWNENETDLESDFLKSFRPEERKYFRLSQRKQTECQKTEEKKMKQVFYFPDKSIS